MVTNDPVVSNPDLYKVLWENESVRVLEYRDQPGSKTALHEHPDSVMVTLSAFQRRLSVGNRVIETALPAGQAVWLPAQSHVGENIGDSETHTIFVELKNQKMNSDGAVHEPNAAPGPDT